jgi:lincosamide nucleotidyltransferase A/C/D/E
MQLLEVDRILLALEGRSIRVWVLGGWGVDALVGRQTRDHRDLDLAIDAEQWDDCWAEMAVLGYQPETDLWPIRVEFASPEGWVDVHPVRFDPSGDGVQAGPDGTTFDYPRNHLTTGTLNSRTVPCVSAAWQLAVHSGYEPQPQDVADVELLRFIV